MTARKDGRGGRREGAGRPRGSSRLFTFRCPGELASRLDGVENRTQFITSCISQALNREADTDDASPLSQFGQVFEPLEMSPLHLPLFDQRVTAGFPVPLDNDERAQDIELIRMLCPHPEASYLIRIKGDSMIDAGVESGDIVIVDKSNRNPSEKEIAVCEINGEYTLKHFIRDGDTLWLVPANPNYRKRQVMDGDEFSVWGTVTYIIHKARD